MDQTYLCLAVAIFGIIIGLGVFAVLVAAKKKKQGKKIEPDYRALYLMGIALIPIGLLGIVIGNPGFFGLTALGFIYLAVGMKNKDKWKSKKR